jgi:hypothetical protein
VEIIPILSRREQKAIPQPVNLSLRAVAKQVSWKLRGKVNLEALFVGRNPFESADGPATVRWRCNCVAGGGVRGAHRESSAASCLSSSSKTVLSLPRHLKTCEPAHTDEHSSRSTLASHFGSAASTSGKRRFVWTSLGDRAMIERRGVSAMGDEPFRHGLKREG